MRHKRTVANVAILVNADFPVKAGVAGMTFYEERLVENKKRFTNISAVIKVDGLFFETYDALIFSYGLDAFGDRSLHKNYLPESQVLCRKEKVRLFVLF